MCALIDGVGVYEERRRVKKKRRDVPIGPIVRERKALEKVGHFGSGVERIAREQGLVLLLGALRERVVAHVDNGNAKVLQEGVARLTGAHLGRGEARNLATQTVKLLARLTELLAGED